MKTIDIAENEVTLEQVLAQSWAMLARGVQEPTDPFRTPVLGTTGPNGCNLRTVVLRRIIEADRRTVFDDMLPVWKHNDYRFIY